MRDRILIASVVCLVFALQGCTCSNQAKMGGNPSSDGGNPDAGDGGDGGGNPIYDGSVRHDTGPGDFSLDGGHDGTGAGATHGPGGGISQTVRVEPRST